MTDLQYNLFENIIYVLYDIFFEKLNSSSLNCIMQCNHNLKNIIIDGGGCARIIKFNWRSCLTGTMSRLLIHKRIEKIDYNGSGLQLCPFDFLPMQKIKIIILRDPSNNFLYWPVKKIITTKNLKRPRSLRSQYTVAPTSAVGAASAGYDQQHAPDLMDRVSQDSLVLGASVGATEKSCEKLCQVKDNVFVWKDVEYLFIIDNNAQNFTISKEQFPSLKFIGCYKSTITFVNEEEKMPFVMDFKDINSIEMMTTYSQKSMEIITNTLQKIYHHLN